MNLKKEQNVDLFFACKCCPKLDKEMDSQAGSYDKPNLRITEKNDDFECDDETFQKASNFQI
jgi:hypothetical protein